jgi:hypothetical protein
LRPKKPVLWILLVIGLGVILVGSIQLKAMADPGFLASLAPSQSATTASGGNSPGTESASPAIDATPQGTPHPTIESQGPTNGASTAKHLDSLTFPIRAAFYYPWFPEAWTQQGTFPYTNYTPTLGYYDLSDPAIIQSQINAMLYAHIQAGIASWWGPGTPTDNRIASLLSVADSTPFKWAIYYEQEGYGNPDVSTLNSDLTYISDHYSNDPAFLRIDNRFVVFVYADPTDGCEMVDRWKQANSVNAYIVLKVFSGYQSCFNQPDGWHQYAPANAEDSQGKYSFTISPGFWKVGETPRLVRNLQQWKQSIQHMVNSGADLQLITTFNEWGEGTVVESAAQWQSASGYGQYLDALHSPTAAQQNYLPALLNDVANDPVLLAVGDIASCTSQGDEATAALIHNLAGTIITLGDNAYESGTIDEYNQCYDPSWGVYKADTHPAVGNHDYLTPGAQGYFEYFGAAAGDPQKGYYSYDIGAWHIIVLNANCVEVGGCNLNSPQVKWLQSDLTSHPSLCTLAYWHQPLFSSGEIGSSLQVKTFWQVLYQAGVDLVLNGHEHDYERFAPQDPTGVPDPLQGIREFVVGTGGKNHTPITTTIANSEVYNDDTFGVLKLTLHPTSYDWKFLPVAGSTFTDSGSSTCH